MLSMCNRRANYLGRQRGRQAVRQAGTQTDGRTDGSTGGKATLAGVRERERESVRERE